MIDPKKIEALLKKMGLSDEQIQGHLQEVMVENAEPLEMLEKSLTVMREALSAEMTEKHSAEVSGLMDNLKKSQAVAEGMGGVADRVIEIQNQQGAALADVLGKVGDLVLDLHKSQTALQEQMVKAVEEISAVHATHEELRKGLTAPLPPRSASNVAAVPAPGDSGDPAAPPAPGVPNRFELRNKIAAEHDTLLRKSLRTPEEEARARRLASAGAKLESMTGDPAQIYNDLFGSIK